MMTNSEIDIFLCERVLKTRYLKGFSPTSSDSPRSQLDEVLAALTDEQMGRLCELAKESEGTPYLRSNNMFDPEHNHFVVGFSGALLMPAATICRLICEVVKEGE